MDEPLAITTITIIIVTVLSSLAGFRNPDFVERHLFSVREILAEKQFHRVFTSAFLHADGNHLILNMLSLYLFGRQIELMLGAQRFLLIYFAAVLGGSVLSLVIHRQHEYRAYGASGGVCGLIFSDIFLFPGGDIRMFLVPVGIPSWLYAILFFVGSFVALKRQSDNVGHDAHLGGAIIGLWTTAALEPWIVRLQPKLFIIISGLSALLFLYLAKNPLFLSLWNFLPERRQWKSQRDERPRYRREEQQLDAILEKISESGIHSLNDKEKGLLESLSRKYQRRNESKKPESGLMF